MKRINFKNISIRNFLSIGNDPVDVCFKQDINFITGINKDKQDRQNAVGKSAIKRGIFWAIFGEDLYNIKSELLINNITKSGTEVDLEFEVVENNKTKNYKIIRKLKPSKCQLFENGEEITLSTLVLTNKKICEIISATPEMFSNCVIMSLNDTIPFMSKGKIEKRNFIEQIFNLDFFDNMLKSIRKDFNIQKSITDIAFTKLNENTNYLKQLEESKQKFENDLISKRNQIQQAIEKTDNEISELQKTDYSKGIRYLKDDLKKLEDNLNKSNIEFEDLKEKQKLNDNDKNKLIEELDSLNSKMQKIEITITKFNTELNERKQTLIKYEKLKQQKICPTCLNKVDNVNLQNEIETVLPQAISKLESDIHKLKNAKNTINDNINKTKQLILDNENSIINDKVNQIKKSIDNLLKNKTELQAEIKIEQNSLDNHLQKISNLESQKNKLNELLHTLDDSNPYIKDIENLSKLLEQYKTDYNNENNILNLYNAAKLVVSDEGVKSLLIKKVLDIFNSKMAYYLDIMQSNCICKFNEYFEEEITNERGVVCSYFNFSGAEKKAIDLACLFSFMDIRLLLANVSYNLVIYDELIDSSLDSKGVDIVLGIIKNRIEKYNESTYIISHRKESLQSITGDIIMLEKRNGITRRMKSTNV